MSTSQSTTDSSPPPGFTTMHWIFVAVLGVSVVFTVWLMFPVQIRDPGPPGPVGSKEFTPQEKSSLFVLQHRAIGNLENEKWFDALQDLKEIESKLPHDTFAPRNMAVAMCGKESYGGNEPRPIHPEEAEAAAQRVLQSAPDDVVSHLLAARIAANCQQRELSLERLRKATEVAPNNPIPWFELYKSYEVGFAKGTPAEATEAIKKCYRLAPENLVAASEYLLVLAREKDPLLQDELKVISKNVVGPLKKLVPNPNQDPQKYLDEALTLVGVAIQSKLPKDWEPVNTATQRIKNVSMGTDVFKSSLAKLRPHPLDFVQFGFSTQDLQSTPESTPNPAGIDVVFKPSSEQITLPTTPLCVQVADFNLDQSADVFVLTKGKLQVFTNTAIVPGKSPSAVLPWRLLTEITVDPELTAFVIGDLDLDAIALTPPGGIAPIPDARANTKAEPQKEVKVGDGTTVCQQADPDVVLYGPNGVQVWINDAKPNGDDRKFVKAEQTGLESLSDVILVCAADFDLEGDLDLLVAGKDSLSLWSNREKFTFKDVSDNSILPQNLKIRQIIPVDWDRDVDLDFVLIGESTSGKPSQCGVLRNLLHGRLKWEANLDGLETGAISDVTHATLLDADANASWDLAFSSSSASKLIKTVTHRPGQIKLLNESPLPSVLSDGVLCFDYDNDGFMDLLSWKDSSIQIARGSPAGGFTEASQPAKSPDPITLKAESPVRDCAIVDFDGDGDLDILEHHEKGVRLLTNDGGNKNHWLNVRLRAKPIKDGSGSAGGQSKRVNHQGVGSLVELKTQLFYQPQVASGEVIHFGLGNSTKAELLRVIWTNGVPQGHLDVQGNTEICEEQAPKGSCPFAYTWNGEHFEFCTDLLWNAPLGLQFAEGVVAPARAWEYLKIPGERMHLKEGKYVLQVTEELWEATYFDQIELLAIDHPAELEIYSNEKVGPAEIAEYKIHTVRERHLPIAAQDQKGRNVLPEILREDGEFTKTYDVKYRQGLTEEHWLELNLGEFDQGNSSGQIGKAVPVTLFLTGWMYPTETSISVAVSHNSSNAQARPPALWIPDAQGQWKEIRPFMGFPGGKTKTIAIDLTGVFSGSDHRLRIVTNMEFYWDHAFYTVGETPEKVTQTPLKLISADLHFRGISQHYWKPGNGPDQYDYRYVNREPAWPTMQGKFTRYGDVLELLTKQDDQLAVVGAGDEITVTFDPPETPLPAGWKRDFIMHNVGWDKDADLHTLYGQTVEPLPFNAMSGYPFAGHEVPAETEEYRRYLEKYQTREQPHARFWRLVKESQPHSR